MYLELRSAACSLRTDAPRGMTKIHGLMRTITLPRAESSYEDIS